MDYEKLYKQSLKRGKIFRDHLLETGDNGIAGEIEYIFPELTENERIKNVFIGFVESYLFWEKDGLTKEEALAWLEKQGNNTPTIIWHNIDEKPEEMKELFCEWESDDATWHDVAFYDEESHTFRHAKMPINVTKWVYVDELLEKQGEQKPVIDFKAKNWYVSKVDGKIHDMTYNPANKVESKVGEKIEDEIEIPFGAKDSELIEESYYIPKGFHAEIDNDKVVIKKGEKSAAWSYEDEANLNNIIMLCNNCIEGSETTWIPSQATKIKHLIETIKERGLSQQKPTEWSDKDENMANDLIEGLLSSEKIYHLAHTSKEIADWLKSIKDRIGG